MYESALSLYLLVLNDLTPFKTRCIISFQIARFVYLPKSQCPRIPVMFSQYHRLEWELFANESLEDRKRNQQQFVLFVVLKFVTATATTFVFSEVRETLKKHENE